MSVAGIILAAGESRRMGFPKALLRYRGETFLDTLIGLFAVRCQPVIVVVGAHRDQVREGTRRQATFVSNADYQRGQTSSLQCALRAVPPSAQSVLFTLVDHPAVSPDTLDALLAATGSQLPMLRIPHHQGRRGHPIRFSRQLIAGFLELGEDGVARDFVRSHAAQTEFLDVDDPGVLADIDDRADYARLTGAVS